MKGLFFVFTLLLMLLVASGAMAQEGYPGPGTPVGYPPPAPTATDTPTAVPQPTAESTPYPTSTPYPPGFTPEPTAYGLTRVAGRPNDHVGWFILLIAVVGIGATLATGRRQ